MTRKRFSEEDMLGILRQIELELESGVTVETGIRTAGIGDETAASTKMARLRSRPWKGQRLVASVSHEHWKTTTFAAGLRHDRITAPLVIDSPMNGLIFKTYVEQFLAPTLAPQNAVIRHRDLLA